MNLIIMTQDMYSYIYMSQNMLKGLNHINQSVVLIKIKISMPFGI